MTQADPARTRSARREPRLPPRSPPEPPEPVPTREDLVRAWLPRVYGLAVALTRNRADAEDLAQEAFLKALRTSAALRDPAAFGPWMARIVRNAWTDRVRRARRQRPLAHPEGLVAPEIEAPGGEAPSWAGLPEDERLVLWLRLAADTPFREIAVLLSTSKSAVDRTFRRALERLRGAKP